MSEELTTFQKLELAMSKMKEAEKLVREAAKENQSPEDYCGYSIEIIAQELNRFSDNSRGYGGHNTSLTEILEAYHNSEWSD